MNINAVAVGVCLVAFMLSMLTHDYTMCILFVILGFANLYLVGIDGKK